MANPTFGEAGEKVFPSPEDTVPSEIADLRIRLNQMINYAVGRYDWYEDQRQKRLTLALAIGALSGATVPIIFNEKLQEYYFSTLFFSLAIIALLCTSFYTISIYLKGQSLEYTHRSGLATISSWYHYGLPSQKTPSIGEYLSDKKRSDLFTQKTFPTDEKVKVLSESFEKFVERFANMAKDELEFIREDLQQVYILYIFQSISRTNNRLMVDALKKGVNVVMVLVFMAIVSFIVSFTFCR